MSTNYKMQKRKGVALILALFSLLFISLLVVAFLDMTTIEQQIVTNRLRDLESTFIADAGVETAVFELRQNKGYNGTGGPLEFPSGSGNTYDVDVSVSTSTITSTGTVGNFLRKLEVEFSLTGSSPPFTVEIDTWKEL